MSALGHAIRLAGVEVTRMVRKHTDRSRGIGALASLAAFLVVLVATGAGGGYLAYRLGGSLASGTIDIGAGQAIAVVRGECRASARYRSKRSKSAFITVDSARERCSHTVVDPRSSSSATSSTPTPPSWS